MQDQAHNQTLYAAKQSSAMPTTEALKVCWGSLLALAAIASLFVLPSLMAVPK